MKISQALKNRLKQAVIREIKKEEEEKAVIVVPYQLREDERDAIVQTLPFLQGRKIDIVQDKRIIAGFIIQWGSKIIDASVKNRIDTLTSQT